MEDKSNPNSKDLLNNVTITNFYQKSNHPKISIIFISLKLFSIISYILLGIFTSNDALLMIIILLSGSFDFWFTKNIAGRLLVGLKWDYYVNNNNEDVFRMDSENEIRNVNMDRLIFWYGNYGNILIWLVLFILEFILLKFVWGSLCLIMVVLSGVNTYNFFRCSKTQQKGAVIIANNIKKQYFENKNNNNNNNKKNDNNNNNNSSFSSDEENDGIKYEDINQKKKENLLKIFTEQLSEKKFMNKLIKLFIINVSHLILICFVLFFKIITFIITNK
jgi:hypothetical protein